MRALRATPVWFPAGGSITGFDAAEQQISTIQGNQYDRVGKYLTANVNLWPRPLVLFANGKTWAALTPAQQNILHHAAAGDLTAETNVVRGNERTDTAILCRRGRLRFLDASPAGLAALRRAVQPVYAQLECDPRTRRSIRQIEAIRQEVSPEPAPACPPAPQHAGKAGPLDGVWRFTVTAADLRSAGVSQGDIIPENYGTFTIVIDRGQFAFTNENRRACIWAYGTLTVHGNQFEQLFTDGGGIAPTRAANKPGELFTDRWSLYRGVLTLSPIQGPSPPKPWLRISTVPSRRFLSTRCPPPAGALPR
jgi:hypothetical protein